MKKTFIFAGVLSVALAYAQTQRVGINTTEPKATLDIAKGTGLPTGQVEGVLFPRLTQAERNNMGQPQLLSGLQIFNTDKNCIDIWFGSYWVCSDGTQRDNHGDAPSSSATIKLTQLGFSGDYVHMDNLNSTNTVTFVVENKTNADINSVNLSNAVTFTQAPGSNISLVSGQYTNVNLRKGKKTTLVYALEGTPRKGSLLAKFAYSGLNVIAVGEVADRDDPVIPQRLTILDNGERFVVSVYDNDYSPINNLQTDAATRGSRIADGILDPLIDYQRKITSAGIELYIPINVSSGTVTLPAYSTEKAIDPINTEDGLGGKVRLSWAAQTLQAKDTYFTARLSAVGADINLKKLDFNSGMGNDLKGFELAKFNLPRDQNGLNRVSYYIRLIPGIPDRKIAEQTNGVYEHRFIYAPVKTYQSASYQGLSHNLGAEYARLDSPVFDPGQVAKHPADLNAFGSLFQQGRRADGHELVTYTSANAWTRKYPSTNVISNTEFPTHPNHIDVQLHGTPGAQYYPWWNSNNKKAALSGADIVCPAGFRSGYDTQQYYIDQQIAAGGFIGDMISPEISPFYLYQGAGGIYFPLGAHSDWSYNQINQYPSQNGTPNMTIVGTVNNGKGNGLGEPTPNVILYGDTSSYSTTDPRRQHWTYRMFSYTSNPRIQDNPGDLRSYYGHPSTTLPVYCNR